MTTAPADTVPEPARAPGPRPRLKRRVAAAVGVAVVGTIVLVWVATNAGPMDMAGMGNVAHVASMDPLVYRANWPTWLRRRVVEDFSLRGPPDTVWCAFAPRSAWPPRPQIHARCGCAYTPLPHLSLGKRQPRGPIWVWGAWPRDQPEFTISYGQESIDLVNPHFGVAAAVETRPLVALPWTGDVGIARIHVVAETGRDGKPTVTVALEQIGWDAPRPTVTVRDAIGNSRPVYGWHPGWGVDLEPGRSLCPHGDWWELEAKPPDGEPVIVRFAPPR